jgi:antitoxin ParD1/3/4
MSRNTSVTIGDHFADFIERQVKDGRYGSASDVVRAGLRLLEEHEMNLEALRAAIIEGEQSGLSLRHLTSTTLSNESDGRPRRRSERLRPFTSCVWTSNAIYGDRHPTKVTE